MSNHQIFLLFEPYLFAWEFWEVIVRRSMRFPANVLQRRRLDAMCDLQSSIPARYV